MDNFDGNTIEHIGAMYQAALTGEGIYDGMPTPAARASAQVQEETAEMLGGLAAFLEGAVRDGLSLLDAGRAAQREGWGLALDYWARGRQPVKTVKTDKMSILDAGAPVVATLAAEGVGEVCASLGRGRPVVGPSRPRLPLTRRR